LEKRLGVAGDALIDDGVAVLVQDAHVLQFRRKKPAAAGPRGPSQGLRPCGTPFSPVFSRRFSLRLMRRLG